MVEHGMLCNGIVWCGMAWYAIEWYGMLRFLMRYMIYCHVVRYCMCCVYVLVITWYSVRLDASKIVML